MRPSDDESPTEDVNTVHLRGRLSGVDPERELPSGDCLRAFRLVVRRPARAGSKTTVDTIDCVCWSGRTRRAVARIRPGEEIEVDGALRRRFFRTGAGVASRYEVEVSALHPAGQLTSATAGPAHSDGATISRERPSCGCSTTCQL